MSNDKERVVVTGDVVTSDTVIEGESLVNSDKDDKDNEKEEGKTNT